MVDFEGRRRLLSSLSTEPETPPCRSSLKLAVSEHLKLVLHQLSLSFFEYKSYALKYNNLLISSHQTPKLIAKFKGQRTRQSRKCASRAKLFEAKRAVSTVRVRLEESTVYCSEEK